MKIVLNGVSGQDGFFIADKLNNFNFEIIGISRESKGINLDKLKNLYPKIKILKVNFEDRNQTESFFDNFDFDVFFNLAGPSSVKWCSDNPALTWQQSVQPVMNILEAISKKNKFENLHFVQALSSEMYAGSENREIAENSELCPLTPYGFAKSAIFQLLLSRRISNSGITTNLIMFNHESSLRPPHYITKKLVTELIKVKYGESEFIEVGDLSLKRDWSFAGDFMDAACLAIMKNIDGDFVLGSGKLHSIHELAKIIHSYLEISRPLDEILFVKENLIRGIETKPIYGNSSKAHKILNWTPKFSLVEFLQIMIDDCLKDLNRIY